MTEKIRDRKNIFENPGPCNIAMSFIFWIIVKLLWEGLQRRLIGIIYFQQTFIAVLGATRWSYKSLDVNVVALPLLKFLFLICLYIKRYYKKTLLESRNIDK